MTTRKPPANVTMTKHPTESKHYNLRRDDGLTGEVFATDMWTYGMGPWTLRIHGGRSYPRLDTRRRCLELFSKAIVAPDY